MKSILTALIAVCLSCSMFLAIPQAQAAKAKTSAKKVVKKKTKAKRTVKRKTAAQKTVKTHPVNTAGMPSTHYTCDMGKKVTLMQQPENQNNLYVLWNKKTYALQRVSTTTGALRYANTAHGVTWVGIPSKGMLLDTKHGTPLANDCVANK